MPIRIQADLPAIEVLESENIFVMTHERANFSTWNQKIFS